MQYNQTSFAGQPAYPPPGPAAPAAPIALTAEQQEQIQRLQRFEHIRRLPMFPLYTDSEAIARQKEERDRQEFLVDLAKMKADHEANKPQLTTADKVGIKVLEAATGASFFNIGTASEKLAIGLGSMTAAMDAYSANNIQNVIYIVRWASPPDAQYPAVIVDVLEVRGIGQEEKGAFIAVKANREVKVKFGTKYEKKIKQDKKWTKSVRGSCDVSIVEKGVGEFALEKVLSRQMPMTVSDWVDVQKRFKKRWTVPSC